jgi:Uncharacterised nucleotidyltransferase
MRTPSGKATVGGICPETALLLCCLRTCMDAERADYIRTLLQKDIDWASLLQVADQHGVIPLLYWHLNTTFAEAVPKPILDRLQSQFRINTCHNLILTHELFKCLRLFAAHDIPAIPYKGPALAAYAYGNLALRQFSDLDILVRQRDVLKAKDLVLSQGYQPTYQLTPWQEAAHLCTGWDYTFERAEPYVHLEIHWCIVPKYFSFSLDLESAWKRLETISLAGTPVASLPPEELLLTLCVHGGKHYWEILKWIVDIAELIRTHPEMDWHGLMELARTLGSERLLQLGLFLAHDLLEAVLPEEVSRRIQADPVIRRLAVQVYRHLLRDPNDRPGILARALFVLQARERWQDSVQCCFGSALTPTCRDWEILSLPAILSFLYYPIRSIRLLGKYGLRPLRSRIWS